MRAGIGPTHLPAKDKEPVLQLGQFIVNIGSKNGQAEWWARKTGHGSSRTRRRSWSDCPRIGLAV